MSFEQYKLSPEILSGLKDVHYEEPTPLQKLVLPVALEGKDALVKAQSGMGKNGAIIIPLLERLQRNKSGKGIRALILTPEVDDARRIDELIWAMGYHAQIESACIDMKGNRDDQIEALKQGASVIVANPGRLLDRLDDTGATFDNVEIVVLDKVDFMEKIGILPKIDKIMERVKGKHQTMLFADDMNKNVRKVADQHLHEASELAFGLFSQQPSGSDDKPKRDRSRNGRSQKEKAEKPEKSEAKQQQKQQAQKQQKQQPKKEEKQKKGQSNGQDKSVKIPDDLKQGYIYVPGRMKISTLMAHLDNTPTDNVVIFTASKRGTDRLYRVLRKRKKRVTSLHGKLSDDKWNERFEKFMQGNYQYLLVTDISGADLKIDNVKQVINYDVPSDVQEYRHRTDLVKDGKASRIVSLVSKQDRGDINNIEKELGNAPDELPLPEEVKKKKKERNKKRGGRNKKRGRGRRGGRNRGNRDNNNGSKNGKGSRKKSRRGKRGRRNERKKSGQQDGPSLPKPSYDKLSGGRTGKKKDEEESKGLVGFVKKLFK